MVDEFIFLVLFCVLSGQEPNDSVVDGMMSEAPGPLNFTMFLTLFGEKLTGKHIQNAYSLYMEFHLYLGNVCLTK